MIFVSSMAFNTRQFKELAEISNKYDLPIEFSFVHNVENVTSILKGLKNNFLLHNFFSFNSQEFTLNLASMNKNIREKSIKHCIKLLKICEHFGVPFFSVHSGFRFDILPKFLGKKFKIDELVTYNNSYSKFKESIEYIISKTDRYKTKIFIENNIITKENLIGDFENPLLMCKTEEFCRIFNEVNNDRFGLLVDLGHLNVSAETLCFCKFDFLSKLKKYIGCFHISINNGFVDEHKSFDENAWFLDTLREYKEKSLVIEVYDVSINEIKKMISILANFIL